MKKIFAMITLLMFGIAQAAFAGGVVLSDKAMDEIAAGEWVVIEDSEGNEEVVDVHFNGNDIDLEDESQMNLMAVNNANVVDSAVAVQTNIARVEGPDPVINTGITQSNTATVTNYNPSESGQEWSKDSSYLHDVLFDKSSGSSYTESSSSGYSNSSVGGYCSLQIDETLDIAVAASASGECESKGEECEFNEASTFILNYDNHEGFGCSMSGGVDLYDSESTYYVESGSSETLDDYQETKTTEKWSEFRKNKSENNHIDLEDASQTNLMAVSNLNSVGSAVAMQTNIASNVGASGTITHTNTATVVNGL
jgi:hypothetical protein